MWPTFTPSVSSSMSFQIFLEFYYSFIFILIGCINEIANKFKDYLCTVDSERLKELIIFSTLCQSSILTNVPLTQFLQVTHLLIKQHGIYLKKIVGDYSIFFVFKFITSFSH